MNINTKELPIKREIPPLQQQLKKNEERGPERKDITRIGDRGVTPPPDNPSIPPRSQF